jgi:hypothetical protein
MGLLSQSSRVSSAAQQPPCSGRNKDLGEDAKGTSAASQLGIRVGKSEEISDLEYSKRKLYAEKVYCSIN